MSGRDGGQAGLEAAQFVHGGLGALEKSPGGEPGYPRVREHVIKAGGGEGNKVPVVQSQSVHDRFDVASEDRAEEPPFVAKVQVDEAPVYPGALGDPIDAATRSALATTVIGIPIDVFDTAALLVSELVTNSVKHSGSDWVEIGIDLGAERLRMEVFDRSSQTIRPRTPDTHGGWGLMLVGELSTRWGVERYSPGKTIWVELDLNPRHKLRSAPLS